MISVFRQKFHYALRGMVPGAVFMLPLALYVANSQDTEVSVGLITLALCATGSLLGFLGGAAVDKVERCGHDPKDEYHLAFLVFIPVLAAATGLSFGSVPLVMVFQNSWLMAIVTGFFGGFIGMVGLLWLESLREPAEAAQRERGGLLPRGAWIAIWVGLALIEAYVIWDFARTA